ncbi:unnamed protein product [Somion occarium]|uniref:Uncharacterized protein n=1 Tax=Somion occarium TaxID=3059160 RepID=A0ABP1CUF4_9APHY
MSSEPDKGFHSTLDTWKDHDPSHSHHRRRFTAVPDLRFEQSYLRSVRPYVRVEEIRTEEIFRDEKGKAVARDDNFPPESPEGRVVVLHEENIHIQWGPVLWATTRDQVISPLLQGALWGIAGYFLQPAFAALRSKISSWWARGDVFGRGGPRVEGQGIGQLRSWVGNIKQAKPVPLIR